MVSDDLLPSSRRYRVVVMADCASLNASQIAAITKWQTQVIGAPPTPERASNPRWRDLDAVVVRGLKPHSGGTAEAEPFRAALRKALVGRHAQFDAPYTVEAHVYQRRDQYIVHLVNYNHTEKAVGKSVVEREIPKAPPRHLSSE